MLVEVKLKGPTQVGPVELMALVALKTFFAQMEDVQGMILSALAARVEVMADSTTNDLVGVVGPRFITTIRQKTLAGIVGRDVKTVNVAIRRLREKGKLRIVSDGSLPGGPLMYEIVLDRAVFDSFKQMLPPSVRECMVRRNRHVVEATTPYPSREPSKETPGRENTHSSRWALDDSELQQQQAVVAARESQSNERAGIGFDEPPAERGKALRALTARQVWRDVAMLAVETVCLAWVNECVKRADALKRNGAFIACRFGDGRLGGMIWNASAQREWQEQREERERRRAASAVTAPPATAPPPDPSEQLRAIAHQRIVAMTADERAALSQRVLTELLERVLRERLERATIIAAVEKPTSVIGIAWLHEIARTLGIEAPPNPPDSSCWSDGAQSLRATAAPSLFSSPRPEGGDDRASPPSRFASIAFDGAGAEVSR